MFEDSLYTFFQAIGLSDALVADLYQQEMLTSLMLITIMISLLGMITFYYGLNGRSPRYSGLGHWILVWVLSGLGSFLWMLITCLLKANEALPRTENPDDGTLFNQGISAFLGFAIVMGAIALLLFFLFSVIGKGLSVQAKHRPFLWPNNVR
jgi:hypothetical protein